MDLRERVSLALLCAGVILVTIGAALFGLAWALLTLGVVCLALGIAIGIRPTGPGGER